MHKSYAPQAIVCEILVIELVFVDLWHCFMFCWLLQTGPCVLHLNRLKGFYFRWTSSDRADEALIRMIVSVWCWRVCMCSHMFRASSQYFQACTEPVFTPVCLLCQMYITQVMYFCLCLTSVNFELQTPRFKVQRDIRELLLTCFLLWSCFICLNWFDKKPTSLFLKKLQLHLLAMLALEWISSVVKLAAFPPASAVLCV